MQFRGARHRVRNAFSQSAFDAAGGSYAELAQALIRTVIIGSGVLYLSLVVSGVWPGAVPPAGDVRFATPSDLALLFRYGVLQLLVASAVLIWTWASPAANAPRRIIAIANDYLSITLALVFGGAVAAPFVVLLLWLTIGNGYRYGTAYLTAGAVASLGVLATAFALSGYWRNEPVMVIAFAAVSVLVPIYLFFMFRTLRRATESARVQEQARTQYLAVLSQQLRAPLTGMVSTAQLLLSRHQPPAEAEFTRTIKSSAESLLLIVDDLLHASLYDEQRGRTYHEDFDAQDLCSRLETMLQPLAREAGASLLVRLGAMPRQLRGDPNILMQILLGLGQQALRVPGTESVSLEIAEAKVEGAHIDLALTARHVAAPRPKTVVKRLRATLAEGQSRGPWGTVFARTLILMLGGKVDVGSEPGGETVLTATIPFELASTRLSQESAEIRPELPDPTAEATDPSSLLEAHRAVVDPLRILSVEDQRSNRITLQSILSKARHRPTMCSDPERALDYLANESFDLLILDIHLPGISGIELLASARALETGLNDALPVIFLTADLSPETSEEARSAGGTHVLTKPIGVKTLLEAIKATQEGTAGTQDDRPVRAAS